MLNHIYFFVNEKGESPVEEFIAALPNKEQAKILAYMKELKRQGHNLRRPMADYLGSGIYELRPGNHRVFYFFFVGNNAVLAHAIRKKTDKILNEDLLTCMKRKEEIKSQKNLVEWNQTEGI